MLRIRPHVIPALVVVFMLLVAIVGCSSYAEMSLDEQYFAQLDKAKQTEILEFLQVKLIISKAVHSTSYYGNGAFIADYSPGYDSESFTAESNGQGFWVGEALLFYVADSREPSWVKWTYDENIGIVEIWEIDK